MSRPAFHCAACTRMRLLWVSRLESILRVASWSSSLGCWLFCGAVVRVCCLACMVVLWLCMVVLWLSLWRRLSRHHLGSSGTGAGLQGWCGARKLASLRGICHSVGHCSCACTCTVLFLFVWHGGAAAWWLAGAWRFFAVHGLVVCSSAVPLSSFACTAAHAHTTGLACSYVGV